MGNKQNEVESKIAELCLTPLDMTIELDVDRLADMPEEVRNEAIAQFFLVGSEAIRRGGDVELEGEAGRMIIKRR